MIVHFKRIILFLLLIGIAFSSFAQEGGSTVYTEADSLQDVQLKEMRQQINALNYSIRKNRGEQQIITDSLVIFNEEQTAKILSLREKSEILKRELVEASELIEQTDIKLSESRQKISRLIFITGPLLLFITIAVSMVLYLIIVRNRKSADIKMNALRKYALQGMEEVREDYVKEIKRRLKKLTSKLKGTGKKQKSKKVKGKSKK